MILKKGKNIKILRNKKQKFHQNKDKIIDSGKNYEKKIREKDVSLRLIKDKRCRTFYALRGKSKTSSKIFRYRYW